MNERYEKCYNVFMMNKFHKISLSALALVFILFGVNAWQTGALQQNDIISTENNVTVAQSQTTQGGLLHIYYLNVGQGDSILINTPYGQNILIDGGPDNSVINELGKVMPFWDKTIDMMILTHPHADHIVGLVEVLRRYQVKQVYYTGVVYSTAEFLEWLQEIQTQKIPLFIVKEHSTVTLGDDLKLEFLYPLEDLSGKKVSDVNNSSIVARLIYKNQKFLFTGDLQEEGESEMVAEERELLSSTILKVGHHGSSTSTSDAFLAAVSPVTGIIPCGLDNKFGHPHLRTVKRLERSNVEILRTDQLGTISIASDGDKVWVDK